MNASVRRHPPTDEALESDICGGCSGSGEGLWEGATCSTCGGSGEVLAIDDGDDDGREADETDETDEVAG